jgi:hypothetical protein
MRALRFLLPALAFLPAVVPAQTIRGHLTDKTTGQPVAGGFVVLLNEDLDELQRSLTDDGGQFTLTAPAAGRYRLKSAVVGIRSSITPPFELVAGTDLELNFAVQAIVVVLPTLTIEDERTCLGPLQGSIAAATIWEEARKALSAVKWTEQQSLFRHDLVRYERRLDTYTLEVKDNRELSHGGLYRGSPFATETPDRLEAFGYIRRDGKEFRYYGPDATVLLSEQFANNHCFSVREGDGEKFGLVGLRFRPAPHRAVPEIAGVLWLDKATTELRYLEFRYTAVPVDVESPLIGGRVVFERLPQGPWIVQRWRIRMPIMKERPARFSGFIADSYLAEIKESGGWVSEVHTADGKPISRVGGAMLVGTAIDLNTARPVARATVILTGTDIATKTDREGRFRLERVPEGRYRVSFGHDVLDSLGFAPPYQVVTMSLEQPQTVGLIIPRYGSLRSLLCPAADPQADNVGIISGFVRDLSGNPLPAVQVIALEHRRRVRQDDAVRMHSEAMTDWSGFYSLCDVPAGGSVNVEARLAGLRSTTMRTTTTRLTGGEIVRIDFSLRTVER